MKIGSEGINLNSQFSVEIESNFKSSIPFYKPKNPKAEIPLKRGFSDFKGL